MNNVEKIESLLLDPESGFLIDLRFGRGIDYGKVQEIKHTLSEIQMEWKDSLLIPKKICDIFMDFYPAIEGCLNLYCDSERQKILEIADEIVECMRNCLSHN